jgi:small subunit ribosomal protein S17
VDEPAAEVVEDAAVEEPAAEVVEDAAVEEPVAEAVIEAPADEPAAEAVEDAAVEEPVAEAVVEAPADEPAAEAVEDAAVEEPAAEAVEEAPVEEPAADVPAAAVSVPKVKTKRLPRSLRPTKTRVKREKSPTRKSIVRLEKPDADRGRRQERQGTVVSDAMDKTIVVKVDVMKAHPRYKKVVRRSVKFHVHDERSEAKVGDVVRIVETRPLSKTKRWRLAEIVEAAK